MPLLNYKLSFIPHEIRLMLKRDKTMTIMTRISEPPLGVSDEGPTSNISRKHYKHHQTP